MLSYRPFLNGDIPSIVAIWKNHGPDPALAKEISADLFDRLVLSKLYFDRRGLIMAVNNALLAFPGILLALLFMSDALPLWLSTALMCVLAVGLCLALLPRSKGVFIAAIWKLGASHTSDDDTVPD